MPITPLRDIVESSLREWGVGKFVRSSSEHYSELVERIANTFSVSKDAAGVRITKLGYVAPHLRVSEGICADRPIHGGVLVTGRAEVPNEEVREIWDRNAPFWDDYLKEGNRHSKELIWPAQMRLLGLSRGESALEIACGNGNFARKMAKAGVRILATDFSEVFIDLARARTVEDIDLIEYRVLDATDSDQLLGLGKGRFDAAVCAMALFDMSEIDSLITSLAKLLKPRGRFVFSVIHPCFASPKVTKVTETMESLEGVIQTTYSVKVSDYATPFSAKGTGVEGQPAPHWYFHRPLSMIFGSCFEAGFVLDGIEEPVFHSSNSGSSPWSWSNYREIPPALVARMRLSHRPTFTESC